MTRHSRLASERRAATKADAIALIAIAAVVAIFAAAIFLPGRPVGRERARLLVCMSNLKQAGIGLAMYAAANKGFVPVASSPGERGWVGIVAREAGLLRKAQTQATDANQFPLGQWELFHCPERSGNRTDAFLDYVSNGLDPNGPDASGVWSDPRTRKLLKLGATSRPSDTVLLAEAEREDKVVDFKGIPSVKKAREQWAAGPPTWDEGGIHAMTVWKGAHLPQGKNGINVDDKPGPRMVVQGMHLNGRLSTFLFQDADVQSKPLCTRPSADERYEEWLKLFGVKDPAGVAAKDDDVH